jgi:thioredoxin-like negative regulator of GroEL
MLLPTEHKHTEKDEFGGVKVTEANFQDVVVRNKKDVLVAFYTDIQELKVQR